MSEKLNQNMIMKVLDFAYEKALSGFAGIDSATELAENYMKKDDNRYEQANSLIRWQCANIGFTGFVTGLGRLTTLPVDLTAAFFIQIRMIVAIAHMGGEYDIQDDKVKTLVYCCLVCDSPKEVIQKLGIEFDKKISLQMIKQIPEKTLTAINQRIGFRLFTKFGEKGLVNLGKEISGGVGSAIESIFNATTTNTIGNVARDTFIKR